MASGTDRMKWQHPHSTFIYFRCLLYLLFVDWGLCMYVCRIRYACMSPVIQIYTIRHVFRPRQFSGLIYMNFWRKYASITFELKQRWNCKKPSHHGCVDLRQVSRICFSRSISHGFLQPNTIFPCVCKETTSLWWRHRTSTTWITAKKALFVCTRSPSESLARDNATKSKHISWKIRDFFPKHIMVGVLMRGTRRSLELALL